MRLKPLVTALCAGALLAASPFVQAKELKSIGVTVGDLANPFFVQITKGAELEARKLVSDGVKVTLVSSGYDLGQQVSQIDNFIAAKVDMIILNAADSKGIGPAVKRAKDAGIVVVAVDVAAEGADATITSDNTQAGEMACKYITDRLKGKGNVVIINGPCGFRRAEPCRGLSDRVQTPPRYQGALLEPERQRQSRRRAGSDDRPAGCESEDRRRICDQRSDGDRRRSGGETGTAQ